MSFIRKYQASQSARSAQAQRRRDLRTATLTVYFVRPGEIAQGSASGEEERLGRALCEPERTKRLAQRLAEDKPGDITGFVVSYMGDPGLGDWGNDRRQRTALELHSRLRSRAFTRLTEEQGRVLDTRRNLEQNQADGMFADLALGQLALVVVSSAPTIGGIVGLNQCEIGPCYAYRLAYHYIGRPRPTPNLGELEIITTTKLPA